MKNACYEVEEIIAAGLELQAADIETTISLVRKHGFNVEIKFTIDELRDARQR